MKYVLGFGLLGAVAAGVIAFAYHEDTQRRENWRRTVSEVDTCAPLLPYRENGRFGCWDTKTNTVYFRDGSRKQ